MDNIIFKKIWQDNEIISLKVVCFSFSARITSEIYITESMIVDLIYQIERFLGGKDGFWSNGQKGDGSTACVSLRFFRKNRAGHIVIEVFAELDDGGSYTKHNSCFYVNTEYGFLSNFCVKLSHLAANPVGYEIHLNHN